MILMVMLSSPHLGCKHGHDAFLLLLLLLLLSSPHLGCKHGQDAGTTAHIQHDLALEEVRVLYDGILVGPGSDGVLEHVLMDTCRHNNSSSRVVQGLVQHAGTAAVGKVLMPVLGWA